MLASVDHLIQPLLAPEERLIWSGRPRGGIRLQSLDAVLMPIGLALAGYATYMQVALAVAGLPHVYVVWAVPLLIAGVHLFVGRLILDTWRRSKTVYGLTDRRVIIVSGIAQRQVRNLPLGSLPEVTYSERADRSGTIFFGPTVDPLISLLTKSPLVFARSTPPPSLTLIEDVRGVTESIHKAQVAFFRPRSGPDVRWPGDERSDRPQSAYF